MNINGNHAFVSEHSLQAYYLSKATALSGRVGWWKEISGERARIDLKHVAPAQKVHQLFSWYQGRALIYINGGQIVIRLGGVASNSTQIPPRTRMLAHACWRGILSSLAWTPLQNHSPPAQAHPTRVQAGTVCVANAGSSVSPADRRAKLAA